MGRSSAVCGTCWEPLKTAGQPCDEHLAPQRWLVAEIRRRNSNHNAPERLCATAPALRPARAPPGDIFRDRASALYLRYLKSSSQDTSKKAQTPRRVSFQKLYSQKKYTKNYTCKKTMKTELEQD